MTSAQRILRQPDVLRQTGNKRSTLYSRISARLFTRPVKIGARAVGWPDGEIAAINAALIAGKTDDEIRALVQKLESARMTAAYGEQ